jgi:cytochrome c-type biogenesis protein CcmH
MNPALLFVVLILAIAALVTWWMLHALKRGRLRDAPRNASSTNIEALRVERSELDRDLTLGLISKPAYDEAMLELEVRVLKEAELDRASVHIAAKTGRSRWVSAAFAVAFPLVAVSAYLLLGAPHAVIPEVVRPSAAQQESQMDELFRVAEERLKAQPNDAKGWALLARARASVGQFDAAMRDYEKLVALTPQDADAWADYADAAAGEAQGKMSGRPLELISKALAIDPKQPKALLLRGTHEIQSNDLAAAEKTFLLAKTVVDPSTAFAQIADNALKDIAARRAGATSPNVSTPAVAGSVAGAPLASLTITLSDEAKRAASASPSAAVFVIVRPIDRDTGPPLAAKKIPVAELGAAPVALSASDAMIGGSGLAAGGEVNIEARLSIAGQPQAQAGDFRSAKQRLKLAPDAKATLTLQELVK